MNSIETMLLDLLRISRWGSTYFVNVRLSMATHSQTWHDVINVVCCLPLSASRLV